MKSYVRFKKLLRTEKKIGDTQVVAVLKSVNPKSAPKVSRIWNKNLHRVVPFLTNQKIQRFANGKPVEFEQVKRRGILQWRLKNYIDNYIHFKEIEFIGNEEAQEIQSQENKQRLLNEL